MDSNFASDPRNQKLVMSYCFFLNGVVVFWYSKKQRTVSNSNTKAKYIVFDYAIRKAVWIWRIVNKIGLKAKKIVLYSDNKISINLIKNIKSKYCIKYINIQHYFI